MSISSRIENMYDNVDKAYKSIADLGIDLTNVDKNLENLSTKIDEIYEELPKVENETASEAVTLTPTRKGKMTLDLLGNTQQDSTTGKNKMPTTLATIKSRNTSGTWSNNVYTFNGVTFTINDDLSVKIGGSYSNRAYLYICEEKFDIGKDNYTLNGCPENGGVWQYSIAVDIFDGSTFQETITDIGSGNTINTTNLTTPKIDAYIDVRNSSAIGKTLYPMIRLSSVSDSSYEPYTNGATPRPDFPQDIHNVSGDNTIKICGKNLFDNDNSQYKNYKYSSGLPYGLNNNITTTLLDNGFSANITSNEYLVAITNPYELLPNTTYAISFTRTNTLTTYTPQFFIWNYDGTNYTINQREQTNISNLTFTTDSNGVVVFGWGVNNTANGESFSVTNIQLEKGSTATPYEPYTGQSQLISLGVENLWKNQLTGFLPQSGSYPTTNSTYPNARYILVNLLKGQSITLSGSTSSMGRVRYIDKDTNLVVGMVNKGENDYYISTAYQTGEFGEGSITAKKDFIVGIMDMGGSVNDLIVNYGKLPSYVSDNPIELCKISTYQDYIYKEDDKWYLHKEIGKAILNGSENYYEYSISSSIIRYQLRTITDGLEKNPIITNYFKYLGNQPGYSTIGCSFTTRVFFFVNKTDIPTISDLQTWLSTHNTIVYYVLATPTNTEITDSTLLETLENIYSMTGTTNITQENNDLAMLIKAKALRGE